MVNSGLSVGRRSPSAARGRVHGPEWFSIIAPAVRGGIGVVLTPLLIGWVSLLVFHGIGGVGFFYPLLFGRVVGAGICS